MAIHINIQSAFTPKVKENFTSNTMYDVKEGVKE